MRKFKTLAELKQYKSELKANRNSLKSDIVDNDMGVLNIAQSLMGPAMLPKVISLLRKKKSTPKASIANTALSLFKDEVPVKKSKPLALRIGKTIAVSILKIVAVNLVIWGTKKAVSKYKERKVVNEVKKRKQALVNQTLKKMDEI